jgi:hypothetical protein
MKTSKTKLIERELHKLAKANGGLLVPQKVVEAAQSKTSPLHSCFQWDDTEAAQQYRIWQARQLIRVVVQQIDGVSGKTPIFVSLHSDRKDGDGYRVTTEVLSDDDRRSEMLADALAELNVVRKKYALLKELAAVFLEIEKLAA